MDQNRALWDPLSVGCGLGARARPEELVAAEATDWKNIAALYGDLARVTLSPVVELNRATGMTRNERERKPWLERAAGLAG